MAKIKTINGHRTAVNTRYRLSRNTGLAIIEPDDSYVVMGDEVMDFILSRFTRDLVHLTQLLDQLDGYSLRTQRPITVPLLKSMLEEP